MTVHDFIRLPNDGDDLRQPMNRYRIEQYELHTRWYEVEAANRGEAIRKLFEGVGIPIELDDYADVNAGPATEYGMDTDDYPDLKDELRLAGISLDAGRLMSVSDIELILQQAEPPTASDEVLLGSCRRKSATTN